MLNSRFILRQITNSGRQATVFVLCVTLSIVTLVALNGFGESVRRAMLRDARGLHGGDIIIRSYFPISRPLLDAVADLERQGRAESLRAYEFYSVVRTGHENRSLLADLKVVAPAYPFYGEVALASGRPLREVLTGGNVVAEQVLLDRLQVRIGDSLRVGRATLTIRDVVVRESDRPVNFLSFGPRLLVASADLTALDLMKKGSRVRHMLLLKIRSGENPDRLAADLRAVAAEGQEQVDTFRTARSRVRRFFDNFLFFLALIAIFTLLLAGIGIHSALTALLREKEKTIAVMKAVGATSRFVTLNWLAVILIFGLAGTALGLVSGISLQYFLPAVFGHLLPRDMELFISGRAVAEGSLLGVLVVMLFAVLPLHRIGAVRPASVFRKARPLRRRGPVFWLVIAVILLFFVSMILWQLKDIRIGAWFLGGIIGLILLTALVTQVILSGLKRIPVRSLALRQAFRGLFRPGNATRSVIITLSTAFAVVFSIYLVESNLDAAFVRSYPDDAPNLFFLDIQPGQEKAFTETLGIRTRFYPVIRSRLISVNGRKIDRQAEKKRRGDNLSRPFNLTYRDDLLADEAMLTGERMFRDDRGELQVSVLDTVAEIGAMAVGDRLAFRVQGIPVEAVISSIRTRRKETVRPYFYFVFPGDSLLRDAPQTIFSAVRVESKRISEIQSRIVSEFPNISVIDVTQAIGAFAGIMHRLSLVIRFFTVFSILAGVLIIISSVLATRFARIQEAVYFRILGAESQFVLAVFTLENAIIGLISALLALVISQVGSRIICVRIFDINCLPYAGASLFMVAGTVALVMGVGLLATLPVLKQKPVVFLREQTEE
ncbi:ABC transporter permease [Desulfonema ishimotonii]|uniref:ABC transporter permease n=1 Tax=Desulfonema ishimotonii TaxID=45657 RepID=A0A401FTK3_9BACT|nr:FtsX-like permease family protein [Desulfonema ishimotonii]GBC60284.1 ABC transporter permease [Desulfonema ishimotonii]